MIIGGEHIFSPGFLFKKQKGYIDQLENTFKDIYSINYTFGGYYSLMLIIENLNFKKDAFILLPSYLCPTIVKLIKLKKIKFDFYKVDDELMIDNDYLLSKIDQNTNAVLFIDYFGSPQKENIKPVLQVLKSKNIAVIQDVVQCLEIKKENLFGDYIFNSFRKFFPFEGSILLSKNKISSHTKRPNFNYLFYKRIGQYLRYLHAIYHLIPSQLFLYFLLKSEINYYKDYVVGMPNANRKNLNKYEIDKLGAKQQFYFQLMLKEFNFDTPQLLRNNNFIPMGYVIKLDNRDKIRNELFNNNIYPPIHWHLPKEIDNGIYSKSVDLSSKILTIPLISLNDEKYNYLIKNLNKFR
jgi:dTDP-4-amino-4,6-dideoxygalactose transaminase